jgi:hypothetical protein
MKFLSLLGVACLALAAAGGCADRDSGIGPSSTGADESAIDASAIGARGAGSPVSTLARGDEGTGTVTVIHGVPGLTVDVYVNGALTLPGFQPGTVTDPLTLPEGNYDIVIVPEGGTYPDDGVITGSAFLPKGANASIVAHLAEAGTPSLAVFVNDVSRTDYGRARVVVRHVAAAPTVDVRLFRKVIPWLPLRTIKNLSNPNEAQTEVFAGQWRAKIYPARNNHPVFSTGYLSLRPEVSYIVYAIGSLGDGSFTVLVQSIELPGCGDGDDDAQLRSGEASEEKAIEIEAGMRSAALR